MRLGEPHEPGCCCEKCICAKEETREYLTPIIRGAMRQLTDGTPVPEDNSHTELLPNGQQKGYVVLSPDERAKGFVKPVRNAYLHLKCGSQTRMGGSLAETYARDPYFYSGTFCTNCGKHFPLDQFEWLDGEPMDPSKQAAWHGLLATQIRESRLKRCEELRAELARLEADLSDQITGDHK